MNLLINYYYFTVLVFLKLYFEIQNLDMSNKPGQKQLDAWLAQMGVVNQFSNQDLQSGKTVANLLKAMNQNCKIQLQDGNSALTRVTNWNLIAQEFTNLSIKITQEQKSKIINGNHDLVFKFISKLKQIHQLSTKQTEINLNQIDFKKEVKDADSLLELFVLSIVKNFGLSPKQVLSLLSNDSKYLAHILAKGLKGDFKPIQYFIADLSRQFQKIINFAKNKENQLFFMRSIKPALISKSQVVAEGTLLLLKNFLSAYDINSRIAKIKQHLMSTLVLAFRRHPQLINKVIEAILEMADFDEDILNQIVNNVSKNQTHNLLLSLWRTYGYFEKQNLLTNSSAFDKLIHQVNACLKQPELILYSLDVFIEIANINFQLFSSTSSEALTSSFNQITFEKTNNNLTFIHSCCTLLKLAGETKHSLAPLIFKTLANRLSTAINEQYDTLIFNFMQIITQIPSIPSLLLLETLTQRLDLKITQIELQLFNRIIAINSEPKCGVAIYNLVSRSLVQQVGLGFQLGNLLINIISIFSEEEIILDMTVKLVKLCLALHFANIKKLSVKRKPLSYKSKLQGEEATAKLKILQIQRFIKKIVQMKEKEINSNIEPLLCYSYLQIVSLNKQSSQGLYKIIQLLGNVEDLTAKYDLELTDQQQPVKKLKTKQGLQQQRYDSPNQTQQYTNLVKSTKRNINIHPLSLSVVAVKPDAFLGLEKYTKIHQTRFLAQQFKKQKVLQVQQQRKKLKKVIQKKLMVQKGLRMKCVSQSQLQYLFEFDSKQSYAAKNNLNILYYSNDLQEQRDAHGVENLMKRYQKILRLYFNHYCGKKQGFATKYFHQISDRNSFLHTSSIYKMINQHGLQNLITPKEIQVLARKVNYNLGKQRDDPDLLDFQAFKQFFTQMCYTIFTRPPKDMSGHPVAEMLQQLLSMLKLYAGENRISQHQFEQPEAYYKNQQQAVKQLNKKLQQNPDYILPEGYKKITQTRIFYDYKIYLEAMSLTYKEVYEVVDQLLFDALKFHVIEPFTREQKLCKARPNIYFLERAKLTQTVQTKHLPIYLKKQVAKFPIKDRPLAKEAALAISDIIQAVEFNHDEIGIKHQNPLIKSKMEREEEERRKRQLENQKRITFDRQLKTTMEDYKDRKLEKEREEEEAKNAELQRKREGQQKRGRRQKELKSKVEEYASKRKEEQQAKKAEELAKAHKQKQEAERKKKEFQQIKRKIEQTKKQREQQEKEKKEKQKQDEKLRKQQQKRKIQKIQKEKKQKIEQFKQRKKGSKIQQSKVMDQSLNKDPTKEQIKNENNDNNP